MLKYSVIIPVYNVEEYLRECIDSILAQITSFEYEIILVDDGSSDGSGMICDEYAEKYSHIQVVHDKNHGVSHARNTGIDLARGEYILFMDSDDFWELGLLDALDMLSESKPDMIVFGNSRLVDGGRQCAVPPDVVVPAGETGAAYLDRFFAYHERPRAYPVCYAYQREFLKEHNLRFREDMVVSEDFELLHRCFALAKSMVGTTQPFYCYRMRQGSATSSITLKKLMDNLTSKAAVFRQYPVAAMANLYASNALLIAKLPKSECPQAVKFLKQNRGIWKHVSATPYLIGRWLITLFGHRNGARVYQLLWRIKHKLLHRS